MKEAMKDKMNDFVMDKLNNDEVKINSVNAKLIAALGIITCSGIAYATVVPEESYLCLLPDGCEANFQATRGKA